MRPRLLDDVRYVECQEGVYLQSGQSSCILGGRQIFQWISRLAPRLRGDQALEDITRGLPDAHQEMVEGLVRTLAEHRFVVDARDDSAHTLSDLELTEYAPEISFIRYGYDSAEWRFQQVRNARILLCGEGPALTAVAEEGLRSGWRRLRVLTGVDGAALRSSAERARRDERQRVIVETARPALAEDPLLGDRIADADLVVHLASGEETAPLAVTARKCAEAGVALAQVLVRATDAWSTPVHERKHELAESGWRWLSPSGETVRREWLTGAVPSLIAAQVVLACFRHLARMRPERLGRPSGARLEGTMTRLDLWSLDTTAHRFHRHPAIGRDKSRDDTATRETILSLRAAEGVPLPKLLDRARAVEDPWLGLIRSLDEEDLPQVPLALCRATVADPAGRRLPAPVIGWGADRETARGRAVQAALATYASMAAERDRGAAWGMDLLTGAMRRVPAPAPDPLPSAYAAPLGVAAGRCWDEAVEAGLLAHCEALPALREGQGMPRVDPVRESGEDGGVLDVVRLLERTGEEFEFRDHSAAVGLPAYTVSGPEGGVVARSVAPTPARALLHAAEHALLSWQARVPPARRWAEGGPPDLDGLARGLLRATGRTPVVVPLVDDDVASSLLPFVVRVVLCDD